MQMRGRNLFGTLGAAFFTAPTRIIPVGMYGVAQRRRRDGKMKCDHATQSPRHLPLLSLSQHRSHRRPRRRSFSPSETPRNAPSGVPDDSLPRGGTAPGAGKILSGFPSLRVRSSSPLLAEGPRGGAAPGQGFPSPNPFFLAASASPKVVHDGRQCVVTTHSSVTAGCTRVDKNASLPQVN